MRNCDIARQRCWVIILPHADTWSTENLCLDTARLLDPTNSRSDMQYLCTLDALGMSTPPMVVDGSVLDRPCLDPRMGHISAPRQHSEAKDMKMTRKNLREPTAV